MLNLFPDALEELKDRIDDLEGENLNGANARPENRNGKRRFLT